MITKELIQAIQSGQSQAAQRAFESIVADKVTAAIDARTQEVAASFGQVQQAE
jgi:hypothetical protein